jgi:hypothetical protein
MSVSATRTGSRAAVQTAALVVGAAFLLVGVLGFVPGITSNFSELSFAGHHSGALLLGVFQVSVLHNVVHLLFRCRRAGAVPEPGGSQVLPGLGRRGVPGAVAVRAADRARHSRELRSC